MSKFLIKSQSKAQSIVTQKKTDHLPQVREVNGTAPVTDKSELPVIAMYKDLNQPTIDFAKNQQKQLLIGLFVFVILGLGIMMGQKFSQSRGVASADMQKLIPKGAEATSNEHYHYDKSCYKGSNGEQICMTRTSKN